MPKREGYDRPEAEMGKSQRQPRSPNVRNQEVAKATGGPQKDLPTVEPSAESVKSTKVSDGLSADYESVSERGPKREACEGEEKGFTRGYVMNLGNNRRDRVKADDE